MITRTFVIRTDDQAWIDRNGGVSDGDGLVGIQVPTASVTEHTFAGVSMLRVHLMDAPRNCEGQRWIACPLPLLRKWEVAVNK